MNLFEKEFLVVPINGQLHWSVAIVCNPGLLKEHFEKCLKAALDEEHVTDGLIKNPNVDNEVDLASEDEAIFCILHLDSLNIHDTLKIRNNMCCFLYSVSSTIL